MRDNAQSEMKIARTLIIHESVFGNERSLKACLHGVGDPSLVGLVSFVFTLWGTFFLRTVSTTTPTEH